MTVTSKLIQDILTAMSAIEAASKDATLARAFEAELQSLSDCLSALRKTFLEGTTSLKERQNALSKCVSRQKSLAQSYASFKNKLQGSPKMFESVDQKANQLFNILSTVLKNEKETQGGITRNIL